MRTVELAAAAVVVRRRIGELLLHALILERPIGLMDRREANLAAPNCGDAHSGIRRLLIKTAIVGFGGERPF
jgi:hypothetical protein